MVALQIIVSGASLLFGAGLYVFQESPVAAMAGAGLMAFGIGGLFGLANSLFRIPPAAPPAAPPRLRPGQRRRPLAFVAAIAIGLSTATAAAQPLAPQDLRIVGPESAQTGQPVTLTVEGLPELNPENPLGDELAWMETIDVRCSAPAADETLQVRKRLALTFAPVGWEMEVALTPVAPGAYVIVIDWNQAPYGLSVHRIEVAGPTPVPDPDPDPRPNPNPGPIVNPYSAPSPELRAAMEPILRIPMQPQHARSLGHLYHTATSVIEGSLAAIAAGVQPEIATTASLRQWLLEHGQQLQIAGVYPGLADAVDNVLRTQIGLQVRDLRASDAAVFAALAWACFEAGT